MAISKVTSASITTDAVGPTQLNEASNYDFTGTVTGVGGVNTPMFYGRQGSAQTLTRSASTKITGFTSEEIDSDTAFDGTTFTVPSGKGGKYFFGVVFNADFEAAGNDGEQVTIRIYKNGSEVLGTRDINSGSGRDMQLHGATTSCILNLSASDTIEAYGILADASTSGTLKTRAGASSFYGYKLIE